MRLQISVLTFPLLLLMLFTFTSCELGNNEGALESLEQNYRQIRLVNRDAEQITADFIRNLRDSIQVHFGDTSLVIQDSVQLALFQNRLDSLELKSYQLIDQLDQHLEEMEALAIFNPETNRFEAKGEEDTSHEYWQQQKFETLKQALIEFEGDLVRFSGDRSIRVEEIYDNGLWLQFSDRRPVIAYLALLEGLKASTYTYKRRALQALFGQFGTPYFRSDNLLILNQPTAQVVTAGMPFTSKVQVGLATNRVKSIFTGNGMQSNADSVSATIALGADGSLIPEGKSTAIQAYQALIQVPRADGGYVDLPLKDSFTVVRPVVSIQSTGVQLLYRRCENILKIDVPALENTFSPVISATQTQVKAVENDPQSFQLVPKGDSALLSVRSALGDSSILIDQIVYRVIEPPKPSIELWVNDQLHNGFSLIPRTSRLLLKIIPDKEFLAAYPGDARYGFTTVDVMVQRDMGTPDVVKTVNGLTREATEGVPIDLGPTVERAFPGTTIYLRINEVFRKNFAGENLPEKRFTESERIIGLVVR